MHFYLSFLLCLSSAHRRRTISGLITGNRLCTDESLLAMQNIWFNISIFHHALTAERVNSTLQFPWTPLLGFFVYANICILSHSVQSNISLVLCLFPLLISFPLFILLIFFFISKCTKFEIWKMYFEIWMAATVRPSTCNCTCAGPRLDALIHERRGSFLSPRHIYQEQGELHYLTVARVVLLKCQPTIQKYFSRTC